MPYSESDLAEIPHNRARLRAYYSIHSKRLAAECRQQSRGWDDGLDRLRCAKIHDKLAVVILDDIDALVSRVNPMLAKLPMHLSPRCGAQLFLEEPELVGELLEERGRL